MADRPYRIDAPPNPAGIVRRSDGRFDRGGEPIAPDPMDTSDPQPPAQRVRPNWVPGIDQNSAKIRQGSIPYPPAVKPPLPFKFGG